MKKLILAAMMFLGVSVFAAERPNLVVILCDDLGYGDISGFAFDTPTVETPRLTRMADEGVKLTRYLTPMSYCAPSRASLLTGRYPFHHGIVSNPTPDQGINDYGLSPAEVTLAEVLKPAGYDTYCVGKWHLGHKQQFLPVRQGFDQYYGILYSSDMRPVQIIENETVAEYPVDQSLLTSKYTAKSIEYMRRSVESDHPFLLYLAHAMPHKPLAASKHFYTPETPDDLYADVIHELDWSIGEILDEIKQLGLEENTLVIFTSDNGAWYGGSNGGLRGMKANSWDGGYRVPFIARWPGKIAADQINNSLCSTIDLFPTLAKLAGVGVDASVDGKDIWPLMTDSTASSPHRFLVEMRRDLATSVHSDKWKLVVVPPRAYSAPTKKQLDKKDRRGPDGTTILAPEQPYWVGDHPGLTTGDAPQPMMLFDIETDPGEQHNIAGMHPEVVQGLKAYYDSIKVPVLERPKGGEFKKVEGGRLDFWNE